MAVGSAASHTTNTILEIVSTVDESDDFQTVTAVNHYRNQRKKDNSDGYSVGFASTVAAGVTTLELDQVLPPPSVIILTNTFQA